MLYFASFLSFYTKDVLSRCRLCW